MEADAIAKEAGIAFNLLRNVPTDTRQVVASGIVSALKSIWRDSWGLWLECVLYAVCAALLECENATTLGVQRMLCDAWYRASGAWLRDPAVHAFRLNEFERFDERFKPEFIGPVKNRVGQLLMASPIRYFFGQVRSKIDRRFMMHDRRILRISRCRWPTS